MRIYEVKPVSFISGPQFFAIMTAHPLVGIFGSTYSNNKQGMAIGYTLFLNFEIQKIFSGIT